VLLTVLVIVLLTSMLAASVLYAMRSEATAHTASVQREQAWTAAMSGVARALSVAADPDAEGMAWHSNPAAFQHQFVSQDGDDQWFFTVYSAADSLGAEVRFGLTDESAKLSVLHHDASWLARLPSLDETLATALRGSASIARSGARTNRVDETPATADLDAGERNPQPWSAGPVTNASPSAAPAVSLDEWFAAAGLGPPLLYGEDANYNLRLDPNEDDGDACQPLDDGDGQLDRGLQQYLTAVSYDLNVNHEGRPRVNLNGPPDDVASCGLPQTALDYLAALRRAGQSLAHPAALLEAEGEFPDATGRPARLRSGIGREELAHLLDQCTTTDAVRLEGLINLNTAPLAVLTAIPFIGEALADTIVATRPGLTSDEARTPAWLYRRGLVTAEEFKQIVPHLTARSRQFSFQCLGYALPSGRYRVLSVTVDTATRPARVLALRDLTRFGFPVPLAVLQDGSAAVALTATTKGATPW